MGDEDKELAVPARKALRDTDDNTDPDTPASNPDKPDDTPDDTPDVPTPSTGDNDKPSGEPSCGSLPSLGGSRGHCLSGVTLHLDGHDYSTWRVLILAALDSDPYALAVTKGRLIPPEPKIANTSEGKLQQQKYDAGNRAARCILFSSLQPALAVSLFADNAETVEAPEMWRDINARFSTTNGGLKQIAIAKFMQYKYQQNKSVSENLFHFSQIQNRIAALGLKIPDDLKITVLLEALPTSWEPFKQSFCARTDDSRSLAHLLQAIQTESIRRGQFDTKEVTALFSRMNPSGGRGGRRRRFRRQTNTQRMVTETSEITCYNCNQKGHKSAQCSAPRRNNNHYQRGRGRGRNQQRQNHGSRQQSRRQHQHQSEAQANVSEALTAEALITETTPIEANTAVSNDAFILDSGSTHNMVSSRKWMISYRPFVVAREVRLGGSRTLRAKGSGVAQVKFTCNGQTATVLLKDVLFVPRLRRNLISLSQLADDGFSIQVHKDNIDLALGEVALSAERTNGLYMLTPAGDIESYTAEGKKKKKVSLAATHRTFAHLNVEWLRKLIERAGHEVINDFTTCETCILGKMHRMSFRSRPANSRATRPGWISTDVCSVSTPSYGNHHHFLTLSDEFSNYRRVYFVKTKDEVYDCI